MCAQANKKEFSYETIEVGEELGTKEMYITEDLIKKYTHAIEGNHPWYMKNSPFGGLIAPPTIFDQETLRLLDSKYARFGSIHSKQAWEFKNPIKPGKKYIITVRVVDKYIKRERGYLVMELVAVGEDGIEVCRGWHTSLISLKKRS